MSDQFCEHREIISQKDAEIENLMAEIKELLFFNRKSAEHINDRVQAYSDLDVANIKYYEENKKLACEVRNLRKDLDLQKQINMTMVAIMKA